MCERVFECSLRLREVCASPLAGALAQTAEVLFVQITAGLDAALEYRSELIPRRRTRYTPLLAALACKLRLVASPLLHLLHGVPTQTITKTCPLY